jgi:hypothetical protein
VRLLRCVSLTAWFVCALLPGQTPAERSQAEWVTQLGSSDHKKRNEAYQALMRDRSAKLVPLLGKQVEEFPQVSQQLAFYLLRSIELEHTESLWKRLLGAKDVYLRVCAGSVLAQAYRGQDARRARVLPVLVQALGECPSNSKLMAMHATSGIIDEPVLAQLRSWIGLAEPSHIVTSVLRELARRERFPGGEALAAQTVIAVQPLLAAKDPKLVGAARAYLVRTDPLHAKELAKLITGDRNLFWSVRDLLPMDGELADSVVDLVVAALVAPRNERDVRSLVQMLKQHSQARLGQALRELVGHDNEDIRAVALQELSALPGGLQQKDLAELLRSKAVVARLVAADTMRRRDDPSGLEVVLQAVPTAGKHKAEAARVLGEFRSRKAMPLLLDLLADQDAAVRNNAWQGVQTTMYGLFPYRRFDFDQTGYDPHNGSRDAGIRLLRAWWQAAK